MKKLKIIKNGRHKFNILDLHLCKQFLQCRKKILRTKDFFFNLKDLNKFIANYHFKMVVFEAALKFVKQNVMMASVGLRDRYIV